LARIGQQCQRIDPPAIERLHPHKTQVQGDRGAERPVEARGGVVVGVRMRTGMAARMGTSVAMVRVIVAVLVVGWFGFAAHGPIVTLRSRPPAATTRRRARIDGSDSPQAGSGGPI